MEYDIDRARKAVQILVEVSHFKDYVTTPKKHVVKPRAMPYKGDKEVLNELLKIGRQNMQSLDNLIAVAEFKRTPNEDRKQEYQRQFMAQKYRRDKKAIQFEEVVQGRRLNLEERRQLLIKQYEVWNKEREQFLAMHSDVPWKERNALIKDFWQMKEAELDQLIDEAGKAQERHELNKKKRVVVVTPPKETAMKVALKKALDKRR